MTFADHRFAFGRAHRFSPCDKKSFSTASFPIFACRSFTSTSLFLGFPDLVRKYARQTINRLAFPRRHLRWVDLVLSSNFLCGLVTTQRFQRNGGFELIRKTASLRQLCIPS